ncbi:organic hydroperoxide resistance protein [Dyadobacter sp. CY356]|uniref:organic hydroperoxide resistance protein n=1 Tax=Dyadobacter sp. CY356 TaxID=2906442 RepID=UPI001F1D50A9|nr:organic hydroperoxide resistance protein [Dyadobacter sp. CY356]MCF0054310.1 organic hydroperoxide resistance protein [Dyadobacter sp. CY356]
MINAVYTATATATGGRNGKVTSSDGVLELEVRLPKEMGGANNDYTNPEQLFAAGYAACFDSALSLIIQRSKIKTGMTNVTAHVGIGKNEADGFGLVITLEANIPGVEQSVADDLIAKAHQVCPYSNATRGNVEVTLKTTTNELAVQ